MNRKEIIENLIGEIATSKEIQTINDRLTSVENRLLEIEELLVQPDGYLSINQVSLKYKVGRSTIYEHIKKDTLAHGKIFTGDIRIHERDVFKKYPLR